MSDYIVSVSQLNEYVHGLLSNDMLIRNIGVRGEISGFKRHTSGHLYFSIKDENALIRCVMFRQQAYELDVRPCDGMQVIAFGRVDIYQKDGQYQFYVQSMQECGEGELYRRFIQLKAKMQAKGYFEQTRKKELPYLPKCVGIVTSETGAALQDMLSIIARRFPKMNVLLCPASVQGVGASKEIAKAIRTLDKSGRVDVMIVGRGGGSMEDLWAFNEQDVAEAIYNCKTPIISAVGHETDFTIADFVADMRAPTPSAAAELCVPIMSELYAEIEDTVLRAGQLCAGAVEKRRARLNAYIGSYALASPRHIVQSFRQRLDSLSDTAASSARSRLNEMRQRLASLEAKLETLDPKQVLLRGYALVEKNGVTAGKASELKPGDGVRITFADGKADAVINGIQMKGTN